MEMSPLDLLLLDYAIGALDTPESLLVAALMAVNPAARDKVARFERVGGEAIADENPAEICPECIKSVMSRIDSAPVVAVPPVMAEEHAVVLDQRIPSVLHAVLAEFCGDNARCWTQVTHGIRKLELALCPARCREKRVRLMALAPHQSTPEHRHAGREIMLVLDGGFTDASGHYGRGDILIVNDPVYLHSPRADEAGCLCLTLTEAPLRFEDSFRRFLNLFWRL